MKKTTLVSMAREFLTLAFLFCGLLLPAVSASAQTPTPGPFVISNVAAHSAKIGWGAIVVADGTKVTYDLQIRTRMNGVASAWLQAAETAETSILLDGLKAGTIYELRVQAWANGSGSLWRALENAFTTLSDSTVSYPSTPGMIVVSDVTATSATLSWAPSSSPGGSVITYAIEIRNPLSATALDFRRVGTTTSTTFKLVELASGITYDVRVRAETHEGTINSDWRILERAFTTTAGIENHLPTAPGNLAVSEVTLASARVSWSASTDADGDPLKYEVDLRKRTSAGVGEWFFAASTLDLAVTIDGLASGITYDVRVRATDGKGVGAWAVKENAFTTKTETSAIVSAPGAITISNVTTSGATISWGPGAGPDGVQLVYNVELRKRIAGTVSEWFEVASTTDNTVTLTTLASGTVYDVRVRAWAKTIASSWTILESAFQTVSTATQNVAPSAPGYPEAFTLTSTGVKLAWGSATDANGDPLVYEVSIQRHGDVIGDWLPAKTTQGTSIWWDGLTPDTVYLARVRAFDGKLYSDWRTGLRTFRTLLTTENGAPTQPLGVTISEVTSSSARVSWNPSTDPNGDAVSYQYCLRTRIEGVAGEWSDARSTTDTSVVVDGLKAGTIYEVRVRATDGKLASAWTVLEKAFLTPAGNNYVRSVKSATAIDTAPVEKGMVITWPSGNPDDFVLEGADSPASTNWQVVPVIVENIGGINAARLPAGSEHQFFRLRNK